MNKDYVCQIKEIGAGAFNLHLLKNVPVVMLLLGGNLTFAAMMVYSAKNTHKHIKQVEMFLC